MEERKEFLKWFEEVTLSTKRLADLKDFSDNCYTMNVDMGGYHHNIYLPGLFVSRGTMAKLEDYGFEVAEGEMFTCGEDIQKHRYVIYNNVYVHALYTYKKGEWN